MKTNIFWHKVSRIGLLEGEDVVEFREVILLNRILVLMLGVMCLYIPLEIYFNGLMLVPYVISMMGVFMVSLVFHYFRKFQTARYYIYFTGSLFICTMGIMVGKEAGNFVMLIPIALVSVILFRTYRERTFAFLLIVVMYFIQNYLFKVVQPRFNISPEIKEIFSVIFFVLALILTFISGYYLIRTNTEFENIIIEQKEKMEQKNKSITDSINYAKRIQAAILPKDPIIKEHLPNSFIIYKPKDIVAGDFYWMEKKDDLIIFAAADCTGHGVPGALVSVICNNALNRSVREFSLKDPGLILEKTRELVISEFEKSADEVKDGMDISLCCYQPSSKQMLWAGANNPLWVVTDNELKEYKADKQPIGKYTDPKPFTTHQIQLKENDTVFLFTDGYQDQFGGGKGKKFKASRMKDMFLDIKNKPLEDQKFFIENTFEQWRGELEQIDDVCLMAVKI